MSELETSHIFEGSKERVFRAICQFDQYPKYLPGVTGIEVLPSQSAKSKCMVRYEISLIKTFFYTIEMFEQSPNRIWWHLVESNLMKENNGSWDFKPAGKGKTEALYRLDAKFKGLVPSMVTDQIAKANLPLMFAGLQKLIDATP